MFAYYVVIEVLMSSYKRLRLGLVSTSHCQITVYCYVQGQSVNDFPVSILSVSYCDSNRQHSKIYYKIYSMHLPACMLAMPFKALHKYCSRRLLSSGMTHTLVNWYQHFKGISFLHLQGTLYYEDKISKI